MFYSHAPGHGKVFGYVTTGGNRLGQNDNAVSAFGVCPDHICLVGPGSVFVLPAAGNCERKAIDLLHLGERSQSEREKQGGGTNRTAHEYTSKRPWRNSGKFCVRHCNRAMR